MSLLKEKGLDLSKRMLAYKREVKTKGANSGGKYNTQDINVDLKL